MKTILTATATVAGFFLGIAVSTNAAGTGRHITWNEEAAMETNREKIREAQMALNRETSAGLAEDGNFGPQTESAVRLFQTEKGLNATGQLDAATFRALNVELIPLDRSPASVPIQAVPMQAVPAADDQPK